MKKVLITGGSEGIGLELAKCFAADGYAVFLCGRSEEKLARAASLLKDVPVRTISLDLSAEGNPEKLYAALKGENIDVVVNNAGIGANGLSWETDPAQDKQLIDLNVKAVLVLSRLFLKDMVERKSGEIINIGSTGAFQPGPRIAAYYASKAFVLSYTKAMAMEAKEYGIRIYCFCPGPVRTGFYGKYGGKPAGIIFTAEQAASYLYRHRGRKCVIIPGWYYRLSLLFPSGVRAKIVEQLKKRKQ